MEAKWKKVLIFLVIIGLASFLRFYKITVIPPGLYPDEAMNGNNALEAIATGTFKVFYPENNGREGLFINIQAFFLKILLLLNNNQPEPWMLRLPSTFFGTATVIGIFFLAKELFKKFSIAALASFLTAVSFWHINFSRIGFRAIMAPFFLTWGLYLFLLSFRKIKKLGSFDSSSFSIINWLLPIFAGLVFGLGFHSYIAYRATPLVILVGLLYFFLKSRKEKWQKRFWLCAFLFFFAFLIVIAPLAVYFLQNPQDFLGRTSQISVFSSSNPLKALILNVAKTAAMFNFAGDYNWRHNISGKPELFWPVGILFLVGIFVALKRLIKKIKVGASETDTENFRFEFSLLFCWLIAAAIPVILSNESIPHALRSIIMVPPVFIISGFGAIWLYDFIKIRNAFLKNFAVFLFLLFLVGESYFSYFKTWGQNPEVKNAFSQNYVDVGRKLNSLPKEMPKYVIMESGGTLVRGILMPAQTIMYITDTFLPQKQEEKNIYYVYPDTKIPDWSFNVRI